VIEYVDLPQWGKNKKWKRKKFLEYIVRRLYYVFKY
jgi:hypothetical protein